MYLESMVDTAQNTFGYCKKDVAPRPAECDGCMRASAHTQRHLSNPATQSAELSAQLEVGGCRVNCERIWNVFRALAACVDPRGRGADVIKCIKKVSTNVSGYTVLNEVFENRRIHSTHAKKYSVYSNAGVDTSS